MTSVTFTPGSRSHWHRHGVGQLLIVVAGDGWWATGSAACSSVRVADLVWTVPGEDHWHGATDDCLLTHLALTLGDTQSYDEPIDLTGTATR